MNTLIGGIGNVFLGDDGFGVAVAQRLAERPQPPGVQVTDFGIRTLDLAYALLQGYDDVILVDAMPRGTPPGTLCVVEPERSEAADSPAIALAAHSFVPTQVLSLVTAMGGRRPARVRVVGCEPGEIPGDGDVRVGLSAPVAAAVGDAVTLIEELVRHG